MYKMGIQRQARGFFKHVGAGFRRFGSEAGKDLKSAGKFIEKKALPVIEKVAKGVATGLKYATPVIGVLAPELLPVALGAGALAKTIGTAAGASRKAIGAGREIVGGIKSGSAKKIISGIEKGAQAGNTIMKISAPPAQNPNPMKISFGPPNPAREAAVQVASANRAAAMLKANPESSMKRV